MIEVRIDPELYSSRFNENDVQFGLHILERLRGAGVPAQGVLFVRGVSSGRLTVEPDDELVSNDMVWRWVP